ncbi:hypothetical protein EON64_02935 [archaeon]|nr:MAG: hypothetical protein EON64_02935 [archaeon]
MIQHVLLLPHSLFFLQQLFSLYLASVQIVALLLGQLEAVHFLYTLLSDAVNRLRRLGTKQAI